MKLESIDCWIGSQRDECYFGEIDFLQRRRQFANEKHVVWMVAFVFGKAARITRHVFIDNCNYIIFCDLKVYIVDWGTQNAFNEEVMLTNNDN